MQSVSKRVLHCKSRIGIQYSHIQHTLVLKVGVEQPDQTTLTWRMQILSLDSLQKRQHIWRHVICSKLIKVLRKCWKLVPASLNLANCEPTAVVTMIS